ncbi:nickel pincer cofactor biosynthesis protein LarC [Blautia difficilis]|uniref:Pyridinium-3,5-bisthiocarboxylic acid mononucleotide nickel insertion protein n=1 Tax=Blautia difficilis TaxID=2763027 RepID=A0ABR7ILF9_9FIRM|nr:nickel pincer cofactor biosynthesis protein LarC [Blautia difficilis]MBC5780848.1 nickel pincer cofactor biosynthesis protein LarC [Blautia difficilis]
MGKTLYLECYSGISGDMTVAALLDLEADRSVLDRVLKSLKVSGFETKISRVVKSGIDACDFDVVLDKEHENHDHDMEYLHGHHHKGHENNHFYNHNHAHEDEAEHFHSHEHNHAHGAGSAQDRHHHEHRGIKEITYIIEHSAMTENAKKIALRIFEILAEAESKAHNVPVDQVHFHEVGAVDSIVDIVSVAVCLDDLDVTEVIVPVLWEGRGTVRCQHGILPIPVPAVANIVSANHLHLKMTEVEGELVTPTGAAIVAAVKTKDKLPETFEIQKIGIGAGKRRYECPGILRAMFISESTEQAKGRDKVKAQTEEFKNPEIRNNPKAENQETKDTIIKMETNIDDCSGEVLGFVMERLMKAGARDVHYVPVFMKKNRPAWVLNVICKEEDIETLQNIIFEETTTIGIRYSRMERTILPRETRTLPTPWGEVQVKVCTLNGKEQLYPEYESVAQLSREKEIPFTEIYRYIVLENKDKE